jgi:probable HAF family extracellular repeat protein
MNATVLSQRPGRIGLLVLFSLLIGATQEALAATSYKVEQINPPGSTGAFAVGINSGGMVVGNFTTSTGVSGYKFANGTYTIINVPSANNFTRANGINDSGLIVGDFLGKDNFYHGFTLNKGKYTQFDVDKGVDSTSIFAVNNNGDFVGAAGSGGPNQGFVDIGGTVTEFYGADTDNTFVLGINDSDQSVGQYYDSSSNSHGFFRDTDGTITEIVPPGAVQTACLGITDAGVITGWYINSAGQDYGFTETNGVFTTSDFAENAQMNKSGAFVSYYVGPNAAGTGVQDYGLLVTPHTMKSLSTVTVPNAQSTNIIDVNNSGVMVGWYTNAKGVTHGLQLSGTKAKNIDDPKGEAGTTNCYGINSSSTVVGFYTTTTLPEQGFKYSGGTFTDVGPAGAMFSEAININDSGVIAGTYQDSAGAYHAFTFNGSTYTTIDVPGATATQGWGINASGELTLDWADTAGLYESSIYNGTTYSTIDIPGAYQSLAHSINKNGEVAMGWFDVYGNEHSALYTGSAYYVFDEPGSSSTRADGINDGGLIVGRFLQPGSTTLFDGFKAMN